MCACMCVCLHVCVVPCWYACSHPCARGGGRAPCVEVVKLTICVCVCVCTETLPWLLRCVTLSVRASEMCYLNWQRHSQLWQRPMQQGTTTTSDAAIVCDTHTYTHTHTYGDARWGPHLTTTMRHVMYVASHTRIQDTPPNTQLRVNCLRQGFILMLVWFAKTDVHTRIRAYSSRS